MNKNVSSFTWDKINYCYNNKTNKCWKEIFIMGEGWKRKPCTSEEFTEYAKKYYALFR